MLHAWIASLRENVSLDTRSLALFRAALALAILVEVCCRLSGSGLLYTDAGLLSRAAAIGLEDSSARVSLHLANGSLLFVIALSLIHLLAAGALFIGWRTRAASWICWALAISAAARNPLVLIPADVLCISLLSVGLFLPWHRVWSIDAASAAENVSPQTAGAGGLLLALVAALPLSFYLSRQSVGIADARMFASLMITALIIASVVCGPYANYLRRMALLALIAMSCAAASLRDSAGLSLLWIATALALLDSALWLRLSQRKNQTEIRAFHSGRSIADRRLANILIKMLCIPDARASNAQDYPRAMRLMGQQHRLVVIDRADAAHIDGAGITVLLAHSPLLWFLRPLMRSTAMASIGDALLRRSGRRESVSDNPRRLHTAIGPRPQMLWLGASLVILILLAQLQASTPLRNPLTAIASTMVSPMMLGQAWTPMPVQAQDTSWIALPGETREGRAVDALSDRDEAPNFARTAIAGLPPARAQALERRLLQPKADQARAALASYLCTQHAASLSSLRIVRMTQETASQTPEQQILLRHSCRSER